VNGVETAVEPVRLAGHIQWWRERQGMNRGLLAVRLDVNPVLVDSWELGEVVDPHFLPRLAEVLCVSVATLLERSGEPPPPGTRAWSRLRHEEESRHEAEALNRRLVLADLERRRTRGRELLPLSGQLHGPLLGRALEWYGRPGGTVGCVGR
jgi:transcriptional regulator with XRE-family HTH domain